MKVSAFFLVPGWSAAPVLADLRLSVSDGGDFLP